MFLFIPTNENGVILDPQIRGNISDALVGLPLDIFIYSHGWWTSATDAMVSYNHFGAGMARTIFAFAAGKPPTAAAIGLHWPSMLSENRNDWVNCLQSLSFFTMERRADHVGQHAVCTLLRLILEQFRSAHRDAGGSVGAEGSALRIHLLGHSFGCKVLCAGLEALVQSCPAELYASTRFNLVLLQAAFEDDALAGNGRYSQIAPAMPELRVLVTKSSQDKALGLFFRDARGLDIFDHADRTALGATGPNRATIAAFGGDTAIDLDQISNEKCFERAGSESARLVVVDLSTIHRQRAERKLYQPDEFSGQHSDIYFIELYRVIAEFLFHKSTS